MTNKKTILQKVTEYFPTEDWTPKLITGLRDYSKEKFFKDLMAGLIVGVVALPLAMAFGIASGVTLEAGLITAIIAGFIVSAFGGCSVQVAGPTGAFIVIVANIIEEHEMEGLIVATIMAGIMLMLMGILKLGVVIRFIPYPIIVGFLSGIAVTIFSTQIPEFLGLDIPSTVKIPSDFLSKWGVYIDYIQTTDILTLTIGIAALIIIIFSGNISKRIPGALLSVIIISVLGFFINYLMGKGTIMTIGDLYKVKAEFTVESNMGISIGLINKLFPAAFTIALLGGIESLISASVADGVTGDKHNSNLELVAQGAANVFSGLFGGIPATGALARTMTNINNGGRTPVAGIVHAIFLVFMILFLGPIIVHIPMVALAAVLIMVAYNMSEWRTFVDLLKNSKADIAVLLTTFFLTIIFDLTIAIEIGIILAVFMFLKRMNETSKVSVITDEIDASSELSIMGIKEDDEVFMRDFRFTIPKKTEIFEIDGPFFFGLANKFDESMRNIRDQSNVHVRIIRMRKVPFIDSSGIQNLRSLCEKSLNDNIVVILSGVRPEVYKTIEKSPIPIMIGEENICPNIKKAIERTHVVLNTLKEERRIKEEARLEKERLENEARDREED